MNLTLTDPNDRDRTTSHYSSDRLFAVFMLYLLLYLGTIPLSLSFPLSQLCLCLAVPSYQFLKTFSRSLQKRGQGKQTSLSFFWATLLGLMSDSAVENGTRGQEQQQVLCLVSTQRRLPGPFVIATSKSSCRNPPLHERWSPEGHNWIHLHPTGVVTYVIM